MYPHIFSPTLISTKIFKQQFSIFKPNGPLTGHHEIVYDSSSILLSQQLLLLEAFCRTPSKYNQEIELVSSTKI